MNKENNTIDIEELDDVIAEFEAVAQADRGPTRKQLAKIESTYSDVLKDDVEIVADLGELTDADKALMKRISKYIENVRLGNKMSSSEYVSVKNKREEDDDEVKELDCDFDSNAGRHFSRMGMFDE